MYLSATGDLCFQPHGQLTRFVERADYLRRTTLMAPQAAGVHGEPDDELGIGLIAPQADVLDRKIDGKRSVT